MVLKIKGYLFKGISKGGKELGFMGLFGLLFFVWKRVWNLLYV